MTYRRVIARNGLTGGYVKVEAWENDYRYIAGDLRRLETDQRDDRHLRHYAHAAGITPEQAKTVLDCFFEGLPGIERWPASAEVERREGDE